MAKTEDNTPATRPAGRADTKDPTAPVAANDETRRNLARWLSGADIDETATNDDITLEQALAIYNATTETQVMEISEPVHGKEYVGKAFGVTAVTWRKSTQDGGAGRYAVISCVDANGEPFVMTCGATDVILKLDKYDREGWLPRQFVISEVMTGGGNKMLRLELPDEGF